jgi:hypothetical protein
MSKLPMMALIGSLVACAGNQGMHGTRPHDMSIAQHEAAAANEEQTARDEQLAARETTTCVPLKATSAATQSGIACWTSRANPTKAEKAEIARHEKLAAEHRAAASALVEAEAQSCADIDQEDRDISLFFHREDIVAVEPAKQSPGPYFGNDSPQQTIGAVVVFRAVPGLTVEWLQHLVNCQMARAAALGYDLPELADSPIALRHVQARVTPDGDKFRVEVTSDDGPTVVEILRRAEALLSSPGTTAPLATAP